MPFSTPNPLRRKSWTSVVVLLVLAGCQDGAAAQDVQPLDYTIEREVVRRGYDPTAAFTWTQAYVGVVPGRTPEVERTSGGGRTSEKERTSGEDGRPEIVITMSQRLTGGIDNYGDLYETRSADGGETWTSPEVIPALRRSSVESDGIEADEQALSDFVPAWHAASGTLLGTGKLFLYDTDLAEADQEIGRRVGYSAYDPDVRAWSAASVLGFPERDHTGAPLLNPNAGCTQRFDGPGDEVLLPVYYVRAPEHEGDAELNVATVARCRFDGEVLRYVEHGSEHTMPSGRGLGEPSVAFYDGRFFLTLRNNDGAYVTRSEDGLHYAEPQAWTFCDGEALGSYNTQQHWIAHSDGLFLVYTRRGAGNDHIFRHRAPLFMGQVDADNLCVLRATERVVIPERGARLGNFGVAHLDPYTALVSVAERVQESAVRDDFDNTVWLAKIRWSRPNGLFGGQRGRGGEE